MADGGDRYDSYSNQVVVMPDRLTALDLFLALALGCGVAAFAWCFAFPCVHPSAWEDAAVAAGLRPAAGLFPGLWRALMHGLYGALGTARATALLPVLGHASLAAVVVFAYGAFRGGLAAVVRPREDNRFWGCVLARLLSAFSAVALGCADPVWRAGQTFGPATLSLLLVMVAFYLFSAFIRTGGLMPACGAMLALGLLCGETLFGFLLLGVFWGMYAMLSSRGNFAYLVLLHPFVSQISKWYLTVLWAIGFGAGVAANVLSYAACSGLEANGLRWGDVPYQFVSQIWHAFTGAASAGGWILGAGVVLVPLLLALALVVRAVDEEYFLPYHIGGIFFVAGALAYSQLAALDPLWFWTWIRRPEMVPDGTLQCVFSLMSAATLLAALAVGAVDAYCRDHRRLAQQIDPDSGTGERELRFLAAPLFVKALRALGLVGIPALLLAGIVPGRLEQTPRAMLGIIRDYVREIVTEAGDAKWIFTDGSFDAALELESAARGGRLQALSMMAGPGARDVHLRRRALEDEEDRLSAAVGAPNLLRTWQRDKPARLDDSAVQLGFEVWKRAGKAPPPCSGLLGRPRGIAAEAREAGIKAAYELAERVMAIYAKEGISAVAGPQVTELFLFLQWRLARLARQRAQEFDLAGDTARSLDEIRISDALDDKNESLKRILSGMQRLQNQTMRQMTPREGLQFALVRADFALARQYAEPILDASPDDPNANFGMGMSYFMQEQWGRAEEFLTRCLKKNPKEPAVWNNIAVLQLRTGRLEEARKSAEKALELIPDSAEVKDTIRQIEKASAAAATNGAVRAANGAVPATNGTVQAAGAAPAGG